MVSLGPFLVSRALRVARRLASDCLCIFLCIDMRDGWNSGGSGREKSKSVALDSILLLVWLRGY